MQFSESEKSQINKAKWSLQERLFTRNSLLKSLPSKYRLDITSLFEWGSQSNIDIFRPEGTKTWTAIDAEAIIWELYSSETATMNILRPIGSPSSPDAVTASMNKIRIEGNDYEQETWYNSIYVGYPYIFMPKQSLSWDSFVFAPVLMIDISISVERWKIILSRTPDTPITYNGILLEWLRYEHKIDIDETIDLEFSNLPEIEQHIKKIFTQHRWIGISDMNRIISKMPSKDILKNSARDELDPQVYNCAGIGEFKFAYKAILADITSLSQI